MSLERGDREWLELVLQRSQIDRIFFRGQEAARAELVRAHGQQALDVVVCHRHGGRETRLPPQA